MTQERNCKSCRWWNIHSIRMDMGDCMNHYGHHYSRVPMGDGTYAMMDTIGRPETKPTHVCDQWDKP